MWSKQLFFKQIVKFAIVGGSTALIDFGLYILLTRFFLFWQIHYLWANAVSIFVSATVNFFWNKTWTFEDQTKIFLKYLKFWVSVLLGLGLNQIILYSLVERQFNDILAKLIAAVAVMLMRFFISKFWVFVK